MPENLEQASIKQKIQPSVFKDNVFEINEKQSTGAKKTSQINSFISLNFQDYFLFYFLARHKYSTVKLPEILISFLGTCFNILKPP